MSSLEKPPSSSKLTLFSLYKELELSYNDIKTENQFKQK